MSTRYMLAMAMSGISMLQYFSTKIRLAKEARFNDVYQQLLAVWNGLDVEIREHMAELDDDTTMEKFCKSLEERERLWKEKLMRNRTRQPGFGQRQVNNIGVSSLDGYVWSTERPWMAPTQNPGGPRYQGGTQGWRNNPLGRLTQPAPRQQLTAGAVPD